MLVTNIWGRKVNLKTLKDRPQAALKAKLYE